MLFGLRLRGDAHDLATTHLLAQHHPDLVDAPWTAYLRAPGEAEAILTSPALTEPIAHDLAEAGLPLVRVALTLGGLTFVRPRDLDPDNPDNPAPPVPPTRWSAPIRRAARSLPEAIPPHRSRNETSPEEALLLLSYQGDGATRALVRLLALGRDDLTVGTLGPTDDDQPSTLLVRIARPPLYLLLRARDLPEEGLTAFARVADSSLYVAWGTTHPLAQAAARSFRDPSLLTLIDADGTWSTLTAPPPRSVYDVIEAHLPAPTVGLHPAASHTRFVIPLRLTPGPTTEPELWLLDPEGLLALEPLVEALTDDELERFVLARLEAPDGQPRYLLQEIVRPNVPRLATRVSDLAGAVGFARAAGTDNLYVPAGQRLVPPMRRDKLTRLLELDRHRVVVLDQDAFGPRVVQVTEVETRSLTAWIDYVLTDRRHRLDPMLEDCVFDWPALRVEAPPRRPTGKDRAPAPRPPAPRRAPPPTPQREEIPAVVTATGPDPLAALRVQIRALEPALAAGGNDDPDPWRQLGLLKLQVGERDEAGHCLEAAVFFGDRDPATAEALLTARAPDLVPGATAPTLLDLAAAARPSPAQAARLGAWVLRLALDPHDDPTLALVGSTAAQRFTEPDLPVSRRLAWATVAALHRRAGDALGMTRAKERLLGALNLQGLNPEADMPRFARAAMALSDTTDAGSEVRSRGAQVALLDTLYTDAREAGLTAELDPQGAFLRAILAVGFARLGAGLTARELVSSVEAELSVHEPPNRILLGLYLARVAHLTTDGDPAAWQREVDGRLQATNDAKVRDRVEHLRKRSRWLRTDAPTSAAPALRSAYEALMVQAEEDPRRAPALLARVTDDRVAYDYEKAEVVRRSLRAAASSGDEALLDETLRLATAQGRARVSGAGFRAAVAGHCVVAAGQLGDQAALDVLLDDIVALAEAPASPQLWELLTAVRPAIVSLRRFGAAPAAQRFLGALAPLADRPSPQAPSLRAILAEGFLRAGDIPRADTMLDGALDAVLDTAQLPHADRFNAGSAVLEALRYWPVEARAPRARRVVAGLRRFTDAFTASTLKLYATYQVLIAESLVDTVGDEVTYQGDRVQRFLDDEERTLRRRIIADWRSLCGA